MEIIMENRIKSIFLELGADICGIGAIERFKDAPEGFSPLDIYPDCKTVIAFGIAVPKGVLEVNPRHIYAHFNGKMVCEEVDMVALKAAKRMEKEFGKTVVPIPCDTQEEYWDPETMTSKGLLSMKHTAVACGLGQLGKSSLLLNPQYGNLLTIGAVLTDLVLTSDPMSESICISGCRKCEEACPAQAIKGQHVDQKLCRCNTYGHSSRGYDIVNCHQCRSVCPMQYGK